MKFSSFKTTLAAVAAIATAGSAMAADVLVNANITSSTLWTSDNVYQLDGQIYVTNGATLTIQPGTVIASIDADEGSLAITRGSQIIADGTAADPIVFTSQSDRNTWTGDDPATTVWREANSEWGNLTLMGNGYISSKGKDLALDSDPRTSGNTFNAGNNVNFMEGLTPANGSDTNTLYGGTDDDDDSGILRYVSTRYTGKVESLTRELNGLSLGGIGRGTTIEYIDIMNNVDDGIELWGGTVNIKYASIWNIGDDSFDVDQGWRGKGQFIFIVQGYSDSTADQGSGVGDNMLEIDGAERFDAQPVTTTSLYNVTLIGQPLGGDRGLEFRDNSRVQLRQAIFMDVGGRVIHNGQTDDEGEHEFIVGAGYGGNGTTPFLTTWSTSYTSTSVVNANTAPFDASNPSPATLYQAQSAGNATGQGFLNEVTDTVFFRNLGNTDSGDNYNTADLVGATVDAANTGDDMGGGETNAAKSNVVLAYDSTNPNDNMPIVSLNRAALVSTPDGNMLRVTSIDPRPVGVAATSAGSPPADGFYTATNYRGAFAPTGQIWLAGWSTPAAQGFVAPSATSVENWEILN